MTMTTSLDSADAGRASGVMEFFRYHGVWAPGVRLFRTIGFRAKALVISSAFFVPIGVLGWSYFNDKAAAIGFSAKEQVGLAYARALTPAIDRLQAERAQPSAATAEGVTSALAALAAADGAHGADLGTTAAQAALQRPGPHDARIAAAIDLLGAAADGSNLTLDPDIDTYYLMDTAMFRLMPMAEAVAQLRRVGMAALAAKSLAPEARRAAIERAAELRGHAGAVKSGIAKAVAYNAEVGKAVPAAAALAAVDALLADVEQQLLGATPQGDASAFGARAQAATDALTTLRRQATDELDRLIGVRVQGMSAGRNATAVLLMLALFVVIYLFTAFRKVLDGGLREVAFHINAMREGDLTTQPRPWGADEAARLMHTLVQMQVSLREIVSQVRSASDNIVSASAEIATGSNDLSQRTEQSAANLQQSASAMEQIAATVNQTAQSAAEASRIAQLNAQTARRGGEAVQAMVTTMQEIQASSRRIGDIIGTIDGIAFQTNILALNAAVEAARAGESGRGFAVVAAEVRQLAQRAASAAREIKALVGNSVDKVESGSALVRDSGDTIARIVDEAASVDTLLSEISRGASEQAGGVRQTTLAVQQMDAVTQQNAALVEQTAAAAASLTEQARGLAARVAQFRLA